MWHQKYHYYEKNLIFTSILFKNGQKSALLAVSWVTSVGLQLRDWHEDKEEQWEATHSYIHCHGWKNRLNTAKNYLFWGSIKVTKLVVRITKAFPKVRKKRSTKTSSEVNCTSEITEGMRALLESGALATSWAVYSEQLGALAFSSARRRTSLRCSYPTEFSCLLFRQLSEHHFIPSRRIFGLVIEEPKIKINLQKTSHYRISSVLAC